MIANVLFWFLGFVVNNNHNNCVGNLSLFSSQMVVEYFAFVNKLYFVILSLIIFTEHFLDLFDGFGSIVGMLVGLESCTSGLESYHGLSVQFIISCSQNINKSIQV